MVCKEVTADGVYVGSHGVCRRLGVAPQQRLDYRFVLLAISLPPLRAKGSSFDIAP